MCGRMHWMRQRPLRKRKREEASASAEKKTIECSFVEAKVHHGPRFARMLGTRNIREQSFLASAVQNVKRLAAAFFLFPFLYLLQDPLYLQNPPSVIMVGLSGPELRIARPVFCFLVTYLAKGNLIASVLERAEAKSCAKSPDSLKISGSLIDSSDSVAIG